METSDKETVSPYAEFPIETLCGFLDIAIAEYDRVCRRGQTVTEKASAIAGFSGVLFTLLGQWILSAKSYSANLVLLTALCFLSSGGFSIACLFPAVSGRFPVDQLRKMTVLKRASQKSLATAISSYVEAIEVSDESINSDIYRLKWAIGSFAAGLTCLFLNLISSL